MDDVSHPHGVATRGHRHLAQTMGRDGQIVLTVGQTHRPDAPRRPIAQPRCAHEPRNAVASASVAALLQPPMHTGTAISLAAFPVRLFNQRQEQGVGLARGPVLRPGVISAARDAQPRAQLVNRMPGLHGFYACKPLSDGAEIIPKFFRMSRCRTARCSSFCSRRFSAWSASSVPATRPAGRAFELLSPAVQRLCADTPSSAAICRADLPLIIQCLTGGRWKTSSRRLCSWIGVLFSFVFMCVVPNSHHHTSPVHQIRATPIPLLHRGMLGEPS